MIRRDIIVDVPNSKDSFAIIHASLLMREKGIRQKVKSKKRSSKNYQRFKD